MTTGVPEEMKTEVEGEAWMMGHVVVRTPNPGSHSVDLVCLPPHHSTVGKKESDIGVQQMYSDFICSIRMCVYRLCILDFTHTVETRCIVTFR